ncbi:type I-E CRISPR-associated protein Cas6/Cse3/CasE [Levilactobacillus suantsaii]|uniref:Type I-E CRISPR-associated protein Cas6/Cse3/CasE n=1 Tax=Levilactobacillus suantsaii TaxID=2292255 RepID=A0A4Q0VIE3_9LACO|nr:type I-E CRISPR-associated protein Cas6/Cse3/CasE [Levilactobacillus suantsaii]QMU08783.1 type I-E CRISPR-associated protein Cas6/Cse3/CasE [Levilactobacillus suantsaii]RXI78953.1 type I-E CRISPR-associated protein Cas6/Cse3/CasE [Levilactobacillus suantsaii]
MYLSRVEVDRQNRYKIRDLTHLGAYHNWVEQSFPREVAAGKRPRHLWRLDRLAGKEYLLLVSEAAPDKAKLERYGVLGTVEIKSYDDFLQQLQPGQVLQFRLTANPTHKVTKPGQRQGRVLPHITVMQQRKWLADRAEKHGFQLIMRDQDEANLAFDVVNRDWPQLQRKAHSGARLSRVSFEGFLKITDLAQFQQTLTRGLGREKAFGMGLMTVVPEG